MTTLPFAYETDLCAVLARHLGELFEQSAQERHSCTLRERAVGEVIPDFVYVHADRSALSGRVRELTSLEASLVAALLPGRPLRANTIARRLYCQTERVDHRLRALERTGVLTSGGRGAFSLRSEESFASAHVVAVEAKLRRWREAVRQAESYLRFANRSYVALPWAVIEGNRALASAAKKARVGIISVEEERATLTLDAPVVPTRSADWVWLLSRTIGLPV